MSPTRASYRPSGRVDPLRFPLGVVLVLLFALGLGWILAWLFRQGWYFVGVVPLVAACALGGVVVGCVHLGRCRNLVIGMFLALLAGATLHASYYHFDLLDLIGYRHFARLDLLPGHVHERLSTDSMEDVGKKIEPLKKPGKVPPIPPVKRLDPAQYFFNVMFFVIDIGIFIGIPLAFTWAACRRAFDENAQCWMTQYKTAISPNAADRLQTALRTGSLKEFAALVPNLPLPEGGKQVTLVLERTPPGAEGAANEPAYLTLAVINPQARGFGKTLCRQLELAPAETALLVGVYPALRDGGDALDTPATSAAATVSVGVPAQLVKVPPPYGNQVLTKGNIAKMTAIGLTTLLLPIALGLGCLIIVGIYGEEDLEVWQTIALCVAGLACVAAGIVFGYYFSDYLPSRFFYSLSRKFVRERPDAWVDPDDPEAIYIQVIPRAHWSRVMMENANDVGFLKIDSKRRLLMFEGDKERWVIPAESLMACVIEQFAPGQGNPNWRYTIAVLRLQLADRQEERPISLRHIQAKRRGPKQQEQETRELRERIMTLVGQA